MGIKRAFVSDGDSRDTTGEITEPVGILWFIKNVDPENKISNQLNI